jgi:hypothetical protein
LFFRHIRLLINLNISIISIGEIAISMSKIHICQQIALKRSDNGGVNEIILIPGINTTNARIMIENIQE